MKIALFATCVVGAMYPRAAQADRLNCPSVLTWRTGCRLKRSHLEEEPG
jgi:hypothetical protein